MPSFRLCSLDIPARPARCESSDSKLRRFKNSPSSSPSSIRPPLSHVSCLNASCIAPMCIVTARCVSSEMHPASTRSMCSTLPSSSKLAVLILPMFLISTSAFLVHAMSSKSNRWSSDISDIIFAKLDSGMCTPSCGHVCSMRAARLATLPKMSYCMHVLPTTPLKTLPSARPIRARTGLPVGSFKPTSLNSNKTPRPNVSDRSVCWCESSGTPISAIKPVTARYPSPTVRTLVTPCSSAILSTSSK
mmetsp:Transcript_5887/g.26453  ORF Transcript_5887/g.26453 Transcript_5887/m.26453 type:complete len:247 (-) Transcript_5887:1800-2540(-)